MTLYKIDNRQIDSIFVQCITSVQSVIFMHFIHFIHYKQGYKMTLYKIDNRQIVYLYSV